MIEALDIATYLSLNQLSGCFRRRVLTLLGCDPCAHLTWTFAYSILGLPGLSASSGGPSGGGLAGHKGTVFCRNISRNIQRYWILRHICRSISCCTKPLRGSFSPCPSLPFSVSSLSYLSLTE